MGHWCYYCVLFGCLSWRPIIRTEWTLKVSLLGLFLEPFRSCGKSNYEKTILKAFWKMCWSNILTWAVLWGIHSHSPHRQCAPSSRWTCIQNFHTGRSINRNNSRTVCQWIETMTTTAITQLHWLCWFWATVVRLWCWAEWKRNKWRIMTKRASGGAK